METASRRARAASGQPGSAGTTGGRDPFGADPPNPAAPVTRGEPTAASDADLAYTAEIVVRLLDVRARERVDGGARFVGPLRRDADVRYPEADDALASRGLGLWLRDPGVGEYAEAIVVGRAPAAPRRSRPWIHWSLALATLLTTAIVGAAHRGFDVLADPAALVAGLPYGLALLVVLGVHEMGHYLVARCRGVSVSLPYFIPVPFFLGTFGAFIRMDGRIRDRATYLDVAAAGPWAGLVAAVVARRAPGPDAGRRASHGDRFRLLAPRVVGARSGRSRRRRGLRGLRTRGVRRMARHRRDGAEPGARGPARRGSLGVFGRVGIYLGAVEMMEQWHLFFRPTFGGTLAGMVRRP